MAYPNVSGTNPGPNTSAQPAQIAPISVTADSVGAPTGALVANNQSIGITGAQLAALGAGGGNTLTAAQAAGVAASQYVAPSGDITGASDYTAINLAISTLVAQGGGTVFLLPGTYYANLATAPATGVVVRGAGVGVTTVKRADNCATYFSVFQGYAQTADIYNFGYADMTIDGNTAGNPTQQVAAFATGTVTPTFPYVVTGGSNDTLTYTTEAGPKTPAAIVATTYTNLSDLAAAVHLKVSAAGAGCYANNAGKLVLYSSVSPSGTLTSIAGNAAAGLFGTTTAASTTSYTDGGGQGIQLRGSGSVSGYYCRDFFIRNVEVKNNLFHGIACYDGCYGFDITECRAHDNGFRGIHVHAESTPITKQSAEKFSVSANRCYQNGRALGTGGSSGLFVFYDNCHDALIDRNLVYDEPNFGLWAYGGAGSDLLPCDNAIFSNNRIRNCGGGILLSSSGGTAKGYHFGTNNVREAAVNICQARAAPTTNTITLNSNDRIAVTACGVTIQVQITASVYANTTALAAAMTTDFNLAFKNYPVKFAVTALASPATDYVSVQPTFYNNLANAWSMGTGSTNDGFANIFGAALGTNYILFSGRFNSDLASFNSTATNGAGVFLASGGTYAIDEVHWNGLRVAGCTGYGFAVTGATNYWNDHTLTNVQLIGNGLDYGRATGGLSVGQYARRWSIGAGCVFDSNNQLNSAGYQLAWGGTLSTISGAICNTGTNSGAPALVLTATSTLNICKGNQIHRSNGGAVQGTDSGTGNIVSDNILGSVGTGTFTQVVASFGQITGYATTGAQTLTLGTNAPAAVVTTTPYTWVKWLANDNSTVWIPVWK
jgi:hypothetical protein